MLGKPVWPQICAYVCILILIRPFHVCVQNISMTLPTLTSDTDTRIFAVTEWAAQSLPNGAFTTIQFLKHLGVTSGFRQAFHATFHLTVTECCDMQWIFGNRTVKCDILKIKKLVQQDEDTRNKIQLGDLHVQTTFKLTWGNQASTQLKNPNTKKENKCGKEGKRSSWATYSSTQTLAKQHNCLTSTPALTGGTQLSAASISLYQWYSVILR